MKEPGDQVTEIRTFIEQVPLFANLGVNSLLAIKNSVKVANFKRGDFVFVQADPSEYCYVVKSGLISLVLESYNGREMVINEMQPGDLFGEVGMLTNKVHSTSAVARKDCELLVIPRHIFMTMLDTEPVLVRQLLEMTANRLRISSERESALAFLDAQARVARLLLRLEKQEAKKGYITISQEELAQRSGLTRQTAAKILGRWRRAGWLITGRGRILLLKRAELAQLEKEIPED